MLESQSADFVTRIVCFVFAMLGRPVRTRIAILGHHGAVSLTSGERAVELVFRELPI